MRPAGLVLAGGRGTRLGAPVPKPLVAVGTTNPLEVALSRLRGACDPVLVAANDPGFEAFGATIVADRRPERLGPLAGLEAAFLHLRSAGAGSRHLLALPGDTPFLPEDVVGRLIDREADGRPRVAAFAGRLHPTVALWPLDALAGLPDHLERPGAALSLMALLEATGFETVDFPANPAAPGGDPFFNVNTPEELARAVEAARRPSSRSAR